MSLPIPERIRAFFDGTTHPVNLAIFRIVVFYQLARRLRYTSLEAYGEIPVGLRVAPDGYDAFFDYLPISEPWTYTLRYIAFGFCFLALVGFRTRTSALISVVFCLYALGVPHMFGKIDHNRHHLIWFAALLAASPSGHALSVDALIARWRRSRGQVGSVPAELRPARAYALPLRFAWLLMGVVYFFPGWVKLVEGPEWFLSDSLKYVMYDKWLKAGQVPWFRIDHYPWLYRLGGIGTLAFELGFPFLIFFRRARPVLLVSGVAFHLSTRVLLFIKYTELLVCYVTFVDWYALGVWIRGWFGTTPSAEAGASSKVAGGGQPFPEARGSHKGIIALGSFLVVVNVLCAMTQFNSWPFSRFPQFNRVRKEPVTRMYEYAIVTPEGEERVVKPTIWPGNLLSYNPPTEAERLARWPSLVEVMKHNGLEIAPGEKLQVFQLARSSVPEEWTNPPLERKLIYEYRAASQ